MVFGIMYIIPRVPSSFAKGRLFVLVVTISPSTKASVASTRKDSYCSPHSLNGSNVRSDSNNSLIASAPLLNSFVLIVSPLASGYKNVFNPIFIMGDNGLVEKLSILMPVFRAAKAVKSLACVNRAFNKLSKAFGCVA